MIFTEFRRSSNDLARIDFGQSSPIFSALAKIDEYRS